MQLPAWIRSRRPFQFTRATAILFLLLTPLAMFLYPGGTAVDPSTPGYRFFHNFFSDLGRIVAHNGESNIASAVAFVVALSLAGLGLAIFFVAILPLYRPRRLALALGLVGSLFGVLSGLSFAGIALTPADVALAVHGWFVVTAFRAFLAATLFHTAAVLLTTHYPNRYAAVYGGFALLLAGYIWLLLQGPSLDSPQGLVVQVTGQKVIAYAAIAVAWLAARGAAPLVAETGPEGGRQGKTPP
jgi:hypothetical membrane protein